jgi:branched-chain amino acid transport system ATP-binding protein
MRPITQAVRGGRKPSSSAPHGASTATDRLEAVGVGVSFGGLKAVGNVDLVLGRGEILGLIGPNGAGKTTLVNVLSGYQRPTRGRIRLDGVDVTGLGPPQLAWRGLARTFQGVRVFADMTVYENVELGAIGVRTSRREARELALELLARVGLSDKADAIVSALPQGDERRIGILRALATRPRFLLLDEPAAGLNENETDALVASLAAIRDDFGCGLLVIEHDMRMITRLCERVQVLDHGDTIAEGTPEVVHGNHAVLAAYLGTRRGAAAAQG